MSCWWSLDSKVVMGTMCVASSVKSSHSQRAPFSCLKPYMGLDLRNGSFQRVDGNIIVFSVSHWSQLSNNWLYMLQHWHSFFLFFQEEDIEVQLFDDYFIQDVRVFFIFLYAGMTFFGASPFPLISTQICTEMSFSIDKA